jgi:small subunit ribosomal protein S16
MGKKNKATYRLIISEKARDPYGRALEILGSYDPHTKELKAKKERIIHWIKNGAGLSATVNNLLIKNNIIEGKKVKATKLKTKKKLAKKEKLVEKKEEPAKETK